MTRFSSRNISTSTVPVPQQRIWELISDPTMLASLTPLVRSIEPSGDLWIWSLGTIRALGLTVSPTFTERMEFVDLRRIVFSHQPPKGMDEKAGASGTYELWEIHPERTRLQVDITLQIDLPLPRIAARSVERTIAATMRHAGSRFAANLYRHLGLDPETIDIEVVDPGASSN